MNSKKKTKKGHLVELIDAKHFSQHPLLDMIWLLQVNFALVVVVVVGCDYYDWSSSCYRHHLPLS